MTEAIYQKRRQRVFFVLSGMFLGTLAMLNILGVTRFLDFSFTLFGLQIPMIVAVGVLPYPVTFMCTDLISELFGEWTKVGIKPESGCIESHALFK